MSSFDGFVEFPPVESATEDGLLMVGGTLEPIWVLSAYAQAVFPWPIVDQGYELLAWFSPDPRAIIELDSLYVSKRLARRVRSNCYRVTCDQDFAGVIAGCAGPRRAQGGTWITDDMVEAYQRLHTLGFAHSIEVWCDESLVGGLYGIALGAFFAGESMFSRQRDASKVALVHLVAHLKARQFRLFDVQQSTEHIMRMGAREVARSEFIQRLKAAVSEPIAFGDSLDTSLLRDILQR